MKDFDPNVIIPLSMYEDLKLLSKGELFKGWISPKIQLPLEMDEVLVVWNYYKDDKNIQIARLIVLKNGKKYWRSSYRLEFNYVKYWMPLPKLPKE